MVHGEKISTRGCVSRHLKQNARHHRMWPRVTHFQQQPCRSLGSLGGQVLLDKRTKLRLSLQPIQPNRMENYIDRPNAADTANTANMF